MERGGECREITEKRENKTGCRWIGLLRSVSTMHPYQLENWCVQWERKRGERLCRTNEGDGIRTVSVRERGRERTSAGFIVKPPLSLDIEKPLKGNIHEILSSIFLLL